MLAESALRPASAYLGRTFFDLLRSRVRRSRWADSYALIRSRWSLTLGPRHTALPLYDGTNRSIANAETHRDLSPRKSLGQQFDYTLPLPSVESRFHDVTSLTSVTSIESIRSTQKPLTIPANTSTDRHVGTSGVLSATWMAANAHRSSKSPD